MTPDRNMTSPVGQVSISTVGIQIWPFDIQRIQTGVKGDWVGVTGSDNPVLNIIRKV